MTQTPALLRFTGVSKSYGGQPALQDVSLTIAGGASVALVGGNGAGKTTLLKCLLDFVRPDRGNILIDDIPATELRARRDIAYLPESFLPPDYLRGTDFLRYMQRLHGAVRSDAATDEVLRQLDMDPRDLPRNVRHYSKGMAQKLGLAACILSGKRLLLLDEPMTGLDPRARLGCKALLRALHRRGTTLFFSTHLLADVDELCDRMLILHEHRLHFDGTPAACRRTYGGETLEQTYINCVVGQAGGLPA